MTEDHNDGEEMAKEELRAELRQTRSRLRELESELADTNEGMVALTLELENAKERYQTIFEESTDGILLIDPERDTIYEVNPQACELLGYDRDTLVSLSPAEIFPGEIGRIYTFAEAIVRGWANDFTCQTKQGRKIDVDISASTITLDGRSLLLASLRDITERKRREQRLQVLSRIFRHNLRNDGNIIQGHADLLYDELSDSDLQADARQIQETIDEILRLSSKVRRIQSILDRDQINRVSVTDLVTNLREWAEQMYPDATLTINTPEQEGMVGRRVGLAVREAVENAAMHAAGDPAIQVAVEIAEDRERAWIDIEDDGPGIPEQELDAMRSGKETQLSHGSSIGLWSIYWVVDSLGGEVTVQSSGMEGTAISISVPLETAPSDAESHARTRASGTQ